MLGFGFTVMPPENCTFLVLYSGVIIRYDLRLRACGVTVDKPFMIGDDARVRGSCLTMNSTTNLTVCLCHCRLKKFSLALVEPSQYILCYFAAAAYIFSLPCVIFIGVSAPNFGIVALLCMSPKSFAVLRKRKKAVGVMDCKKCLKSAKYHRKTAERVTPMKGMVNDVQVASMMKRPAMQRLSTTVGVFKCKNRKPRCRSIQQLCALYFGKILRLCMASYEKINHIRLNTKSEQRLFFKVFCL